ncbi:MAG: heme-copper oxidase subunit III [Chloroflexi bacterium]|nr:heme-copper oxidase subunit III [Chloroflexota bacterium]
MAARAHLAATERPLQTPIGLGMVLFLISEAFLFGSLFIIYYYLRAYTATWPPAGVEPHFETALANTVILLSSSATVSLAGRAIHKGSVAGLSGWLTVTIVLGTAFLAIKMYEWSSNAFGPADHAYGSIYYTLTGFHALHVLIGLGFLGALLMRTRAGRFSAQRFLAVELGALYWHFVDAVWVLVFATIYLVR